MARPEHIESLKNALKFEMCSAAWCKNEIERLQTQVRDCEERIEELQRRIQEAEEIEAL